jgi:hypothetical protein
MHQLPGGSSIDLKGRQQAACTVCGNIMPAGMLQQKLLELQAAAADADSACSIMAAVQEQRQEQGAVQNAHQLQAGSATELANNQQEYLQQHQQQLERVQKAVELLCRATAVREQHLTAGNLLLGHCHHATAAAAVEAAVLAGSALRHGDSSRASCAAAQDTDSLQQSLAVLQDSISMQTEMEVCNVLMRLQQCMEAFVCAGMSVDPSSSSRTAENVGHNINAILQLPCSCMQEGPAQLPGAQHNPAQARAGPASCNSRPAQGVSAHAALQDSLLLAFRHFSSSVAVLACSQPQDSLPLAAERAACCAAGLALVAAMGGCCAASPVSPTQGAVSTVEAAQPGVGVKGSAVSCCRCSAVFHVAASMLQHVVGVVAVQLGVLG